VVKVRPFRGDTSGQRWEVDIRFRWPADRSWYRERAKATVPSRSNALRWGQAREAALLAAGKPPEVIARATETSDAWHERYLEHCASRGITTTSDKRLRWSKWISPTIGQRPMASVTRGHVEDVRDALDAAIVSGALRWKTSQNVWAEVTVSFREASSSKVRALRILTSDPTRGVQAPERGVPTSKCYPYPSELLTLAACDDVPLRWREVHVIAAYAYLRPGELWCLEWSDVDLADQTIRITKAWDFQAGRAKATKTGETRTIPIEPTLLPLLQRMHKRARGRGLVCPCLSQRSGDTLAVLVRRHFTLAGITRPRLTARGRAERRLVFRSWRDAGITWSIVRGDPVTQVSRRAGHRDLATTMRYVVEAENRGATFGVPFPALPACLTGQVGEMVEKAAE
jgi:integrase